MLECSKKAHLIKEGALGYVILSKTLVLFQQLL